MELFELVADRTELAEIDKMLDAAVEKRGQIRDGEIKVDADETLLAYASVQILSAARELKRAITGWDSLKAMSK